MLKGKFAVKGFMFLMVMALLGGCGNFVRKDLGPEITQAKRYGVLLTKFSVDDRHVPAHIDIPFVDTTWKAMRDEISKLAGSPSAEWMTENGDFSGVAEQYSAYHPPYKALSGDNDYGDLKALFAKNQIDVLLVLEVVAAGQDPGWSGLGYMAASLATGVVMGGGSPMMIGRLVAIDPNGKVIFSGSNSFVNKLFSSAGSIKNPESVRNMAKTMIEDYRDHVLH